MNNEHLIDEIFNDVIDLLYENHSEALIGDHYEDYYRPELMQEIIALRDKYKSECNKIDLKKVLVPYDDGDECDEEVVTPVICNGRADVIPTKVNTVEVGVTSTFICGGEVKEVYLK